MQKIILVFVLIILALTNYTESDPSHLDTPAIIPEPAHIQVHDETFTVNRETVILTDDNQQDVTNIARQLKQVLDSGIGSNIEIATKTGNQPAKNVISFSIDKDTSAFDSAEGYELKVTEEKVSIRAETPSGLFYGMQSLLQLFPPQIYQSDYTLVPQNVEWTIPTVDIRDYPRFEYRGMHLDVARHFFPVEFIKKYIDLMAMHKMNRFHWHLTEDQGWRIEIQQYPKLTKIGAWRDSTLVGHYGTDIYDGKKYGGYYTQEEIREIVDYAQKRHITVIPEIEMPGHASAALASYPEFGCIENKEYKVKTTWGIFEDIYCPSEQTFIFLENILVEIMELFPSEYIHIGGDEAPKKQWKESDLAQQVIQREGLENEEELQSYFITRIQEFLNANGRQIIGWDEILEGGLAPNATVMSWRGMEGGIKTAKQQHNVIMTPTSHAYLDYYQAEPKAEPLAIGGFSPLKEVYNFEPIPEELTTEESQYILGAQGNVWTEYMHTGNKVEYMAYPRASAISEVTWSPKPKRNWTDFWQRMQTHFDRFEILDVNAAQHYHGKMLYYSE
jgi:hexosaminidase